MGIGKSILKTLEAVSEAAEKQSAFLQAKKEQETLAHVRGERHEQKYCQVCIAAKEAEQTEYEVPDCQKHEFGECKANCRYRTGIVEDCTWHDNQECPADCRWRKA